MLGFSEWYHTGNSDVPSINILYTIINVSITSQPLLSSQKLYKSFMIHDVFCQDQTEEQNRIC